MVARALLFEALSRRRLIAGVPMMLLTTGRSRAAPLKVKPLPGIVKPGTQLEMLIRFIADGSGRERGVERVTYSFNADGTTTMSARSESFDPPVVRNVLYLLGSDFRPRSCHVQITTAGRHVGSGWFRVTPSEVEMEADTVAKGRVHERVALADPMLALVAHPVSSDVHVGMAADRTRQGEIVPAEGVYLTSADPYGRTGPELVKADVAIAYMGREHVDTPLGALPADHHLLYLRRPDGRFEAFQDLWCAADTAVFLKAYARPPVATRYEIAELAVLPGAAA
jgi:hypothetical protein